MASSTTYERSSAADNVRQSAYFICFGIQTVSSHSCLFFSRLSFTLDEISMIERI